MVFDVNDKNNGNLGFEDFQGKLIADGTSNNIDIGAHYPYNSERWRILVDGSRVFPEYNAVPQYTHNVDIHDLAPQTANETVVMQTQERLSYVVQYEQQITWAFGLNQDLGPGDKIRIGFYDGIDGYLFEQDGDIHGSKFCRLITLRNNVEIATEEDVELPLKTDNNFLRLALRTLWYRVGRQLWDIDGTSNGRFVKNTIGSLSIDSGLDTGPRTGNLPLRFEITGGGNGLVLKAGSVGAVTYGRVTPKVRKKTSFLEKVPISTTGTWVPIAAIRKDPDRKIVQTRLIDVNVLEYTGGSDADIKVKALLIDKSKTDASGWQTPNTQTKNNSVIEETQSITTFPNDSGTVVTSTDNPGGAQIALSWLYQISTGTSNNASVSSSSGSEETKAPIPEDDICIIVVEATSVGDVTIQYTTQQDW